MLISRNISKSEFDSFYIINAVKIELAKANLHFNFPAYFVIDISTINIIRKMRPTKFKFIHHFFKST